MGADARRFALLTAALAVALFAGSFLLVALASALGGEGWLAPFFWLGGLDAAQAADRVTSAAEVVAGVLSVAITVVAIVVELAANRYTHRITQLFVQEPINVLVMGLFVVTTVICMWVATDPGLPESALVPVRNAPAGLAVVLSTLCLLILLPYFAYVFRFLSPLAVVDRMRRAGMRELLRGVRRPAAARPRLVEVVEELEDIARGAQEHSDRAIALAAVESLVELIRCASAQRDALPEAWFEIDARVDPDFVAMAPIVLEETRRERLWLETKVLRKFLDLFRMNLGNWSGLADLIALETRVVTEAAHPARPELVALCLRFFNSYLRGAINARDLRTAYYVLDQYRLLAEAMLASDDASQVPAVARDLSLYGRLGFELGQEFLLEVVAYDLGALIESSVTLRPELTDPLLELFLQVDREAESTEQETRIRGVRRAQVRLATFFLVRGDRARARRIFEDMEHERTERLVAVRAEIEAVTQPQYHEFTDRGVSFAYLPPERRAQLAHFFAWFGDRLAGGPDGAA